MRIENVLHGLADQAIVHAKDGGVIGVAKDPRPFGGVVACISRVTAVRPKVRICTEIEERCRLHWIELRFGERTHNRCSDEEGHEDHGHLMNLITIQVSSTPNCALDTIPISQSEDSEKSVSQRN